MTPRTRGALSLAGYLITFLWLTYPLVREPTASVIGEWSPDLEHSLWAQWWFDTAVASPEHDLFHTAMIDHPLVVDLQLADLNLAVNGPVHLLGFFVGPAAAYNLALLASFLLAACLAQRLATRLGASPDAAWLAGLFFAGSPYWVASALNGWGYLVHTWPLPLVFLSVLSFHERPGLRSGAGFGLALALAFHVTPYYFLYATVLLLLLGMFRSDAVRAWSGPEGWKALGATAVTLLVLVGPRALAMAVAASGDLVVHHDALNTDLAAPLVETVWPAVETVASRRPRVGYLVVFVGYALLGALALSLRSTGDCPGVRAWWAAAGVALLLALGPSLKIADGMTTAIPLPGALLQRVPGFDLTTNHWRWTLPASFCLVIVLARTLTALERRFERTHPFLVHALVPTCVVVFVLEATLLWPLPYPRPVSELRTSPVAALLRDRDDVHAILDRTDRRKLNQTVHGKPIALGWLPRIDLASHRASEEMVASCRGQGLECLRRFGIDAVIRDDRTALLLDERGAVREVLHSEP